MNILIGLCGLLLFAYLADISAKKTKIPSIIVLIAMGLGLKELIKLFYPQYDKLIDINLLLPVLGNLGLVLIVLEGAIELELSRKKMLVISKTLIGSFASILAVSFLLAYLMSYLSGQNDLKKYVINVIPMSIISSAIAIPAVRYMSKQVREFVVYESSLSDITGVLIFYFFILNEEITAKSFVFFAWDVLLMLLISLIVSILLSLFLSKINHHVKFIPIIVTVVLVYSISKQYHLPSLILILVFGLSLKNLEKLSHYENFRGFINYFHPEILNRELKKFEDIVNEFSFLIRTAFFITFGFSLNVSDIMDIHALQWSLLIIAVIYLVRLMLILSLKIELNPVFLIAPRGLISILLFISIPTHQRIDIINNAVLVQVVLISVVLMAVGNMFYKREV